MAVEPPTAIFCAFGASSVLVPGLGCLVAGDRRTSLSVSFLWYPERAETAWGCVSKHRKWSQLGERLLTRSPNTNQNTTVDASWVKSASGICSLEMSVLHRAGLTLLGCDSPLLTQRHCTGNRLHPFIVLSDQSLLTSWEPEAQEKQRQRCANSPCAVLSKGCD